MTTRRIGQILLLLWLVLGVASGYFMHSYFVGIVAAGVTLIIGLVLVTHRVSDGATAPNRRPTEPNQPEYDCRTQGHIWITSLDPNQSSVCKECNKQCEHWFRKNKCEYCGTPCCSGDCEFDCPCMHDDSRSRARECSCKPCSYMDEYPLNYEEGISMKHGIAA